MQALKVFNLSGNQLKFGKVCKMLIVPLLNSTGTLLNRFYIEKNKIKIYFEIVKSLIPVFPSKLISPSFTVHQNCSHNKIKMIHKKQMNMLKPLDIDY